MTSRQTEPHDLPFVNNRSGRNSLYCNAFISMMQVCWSSFMRELPCQKKIRLTLTASKAPFWNIVQIAQIQGTFGNKEFSFFRHGHPKKSY